MQKTPRSTYLPESNFLMRRVFFVMILVSSLRLTAQQPDPANESIWTRINDDDPTIVYSGNIQAQSNPAYYNKDMHSTNAVGETCTVSFTGTGIRWIGGKNNDHGKADVYLDGKFDATVDTSALTWLTEQDLYTKTGLSNQPHTLRVQVKTAGFEDFDAFEFQAPPPPPPAPKNLGHLFLPDQVPYLNTKERYPLGSGVALAVGEPNGAWTQLTGPGYTSPNLIVWEAVTLEIDGVERPLTLEMKRAEKTGVYYGVKTFGEVRVWLIDYTNWGQPWVSRLVLVENMSATVAHDVRVGAVIIPQTGPGMTHRLAEDSSHNRCGAVIQADTSVSIPFGGKNSKKKTVIISFTDPSTEAFFSTDALAYHLETKPIHLLPSGSGQFLLGHYFREDETPDGVCIDRIRALSGTAELEKSITDWRAWLDGVGPEFQLGRIKDERARRLVEGGLTVLKTNQSQDGGLIAHSTFYKEGYIRDAALGLRALTATGHFEEAKRWLAWVDRKLALYGIIMDSASCDPSLDDRSNLHEGKMQQAGSDVEGTALVLLCARDYYAGTQDVSTLNAVRKTLQHCMDIQLKDAVANGYKLGFNGDETEICGVIDVTPTGTQILWGAQQNDWALSSLALCSASLDFYITYLKSQGEDPTHYKNSETGTTMNLPAEQDHLLKAMDTDFWRTDVPENPEGFHDAFRIRKDGAWPLKRIVNFTLMPVYFGTPYAAERKASDVRAIAHYFDSGTGFLQLIPGTDKGFEGHDLGYLLWGLVEINDPRKTGVYEALVNGPTVDCWGSYNEAYSAKGERNEHDLRSLETGVNLSAIAKYWNLGAR